MLAFFSISMFDVIVIGSLPFIFVMQDSPSMVITIFSLIMINGFIKNYDFLNFISTLKKTLFVILQIFVLPTKRVITPFLRA